MAASKYTDRANRAKPLNKCRWLEHTPSKTDDLNAEGNQ